MSIPTSERATARFPQTDFARILICFLVVEQVADRKFEAVDQHDVVRAGFAAGFLHENGARGLKDDAFLLRHPGGILSSFAFQSAFAAQSALSGAVPAVRASLALCRFACGNHIIDALTGEATRVFGFAPEFLLAPEVDL
jgi:hypothetical protein